MNRVVWCVLLGAIGCFDPASQDARDAAGLDATVGSDGVIPPADGRARTDGGGDATPIEGCAAGTLCDLRADFASPEPGWSERVSGACSVTVAGGTVRITSSVDCTAGTSCELRSPERPIGTGRVVTRTIELAPEVNGDLWFEVVDRSHDGPRIIYRPGHAVSAILDGGVETGAGTVERGDAATWAIRLDDGGFAHFERWDEGSSSWIEFGSAGAPWGVGERVTLALGLTCSGVTGDTIVGEWGPVGGAP